MNSIPSPVGVPLFSGLGQSGFIYQLAAADDDTALGRLYRFSYDCTDGQCSGTAKDVWIAMPVAQKEAYLSSLADAVVAAYPKQPFIQILVTTGSSLNVLSAIQLRNGIHSFSEPEPGSKSDTWVWTDHLTH